jgi:hypothetical protein
MTGLVENLAITRSSAVWRRWCHCGPASCVQHACKKQPAATKVLMLGQRLFHNRLGVGSGLGRPD